MFFSNIILFNINRTRQSERVQATLASRHANEPSTSTTRRLNSQREIKSTNKRKRRKTKRRRRKKKTKRVININ